MTAAVSPIQFPLLNGVRHSFTSIELKFAAVPGGPSISQVFFGFKSLNYTRTRNRVLVRGNSPDPLGKTQGENDYSADCELYLAEWNLLMTTLGPGYGDAAFMIQASYSANGFDTIQDTVTGCTIDSTEASQSQGPDPLTRKINLMPLKVLFNGVDDLATPLRGVAQ